MSLLVQYIQSLEDSSYNNVKEHFTDRRCRVIDSGEHYMISISNDFSVYSELSVEFKNAICCAIGTILNKNTNEIVCYGFPLTQEIEQYSNEPFLGSLVASEYIEGTVLRAFYDGTNWRLSTNGAMNAYESYWISTKSFGELFDSCLSRIYGNNTSFYSSRLVESLDTDCTYQFILTDPSVHLQKSGKSFIYHIGTFSNRTMRYVDHTVERNIPVPKTVTFDSFTELVQKLKSNDTANGYVFYPSNSLDTQQPRYKILSENYVKRRKLIGNTPNMYLRYLECKAEGTDAELLKEFPALRFYSSWVDKCLSTIAKRIHLSYVEKFIIKNKSASVNFYYRPIIYELHGNFMKTQEKVTYQVVYKLLTSSHPKRINFILNGLKLIQTSDFVSPSLSVKEEIEEKQKE
jgi:hypothetical protein